MTSESPAEKPVVRMFRITVGILCTCLMLLAATFYLRIVRLEGVIRVSLAITPGVPVDEVERRLGVHGKAWPYGQPEGTRLIVPHGGHVVTFSSYQASWNGDSMEISIAVDRENRVVSVDYLEQPLSWSSEHH